VPGLRPSSNVNTRLQNPMNNIHLLAISGSLRAHSSNTETLRALTLLAPPEVTITPFDGLAALPHFNPDHDVEGMALPEAVQSLRAQIEAADGIVISSPEYAHGVPGSLKNALDWSIRPRDRHTRRYRSLRRCARCRWRSSPKSPSLSRSSIV